MDLGAYLNRIQFSGTPHADLETLNALMAAHVRAIPFENLDVYAERGVSAGLETVFDKIVNRGRGGWCYEMNTLFEWVLRNIGFDVQRLSAGVRRAKLGDAALGNHLCLSVELDQTYLVDVGYGGSQLFALPLKEEVTTHGPLRLALTKTDDGFWRFHEGGADSLVSYDFKPGWCNEDLLSASHDRQMNDPDEIFRKTLVAKIRRGDDYLILRGRALETLKPGRKERRFADTPHDLAAILSDVFGLTEPDLDRLWPKITERHRQLWPHEEGGRLA